MPAGANDVGRDTGLRVRAETRDFDEVETMNEDTKRLDLWLEGAAATVGLEIPEIYRKHVIAQLELNRSLIAPLLDFELPTADFDS